MFIQGGVPYVLADTLAAHDIGVTCTASVQSASTCSTGLESLFISCNMCFLCLVLNLCTIQGGNCKHCESKVPLQKHSSRTFYHTSCNNHVMDDGFKVGVGFALRKCRMCMATREQLSIKVCVAVTGRK